MYYSIEVSDVQQLFGDGNRIFYTTDRKRPLYIDRVKIGFGYRSYFVCPECGNRAVRLYLCGNRFVCRNCGKVPVYRGIQNMTKGGYREIQYRMERYGAKHDIEFDYPFNFMKFREHPDREAVRVLQAMENMRLQSALFGVRYESVIFKSVVSGDHPVMKDDSVTLKDLRDHFFNWKNMSNVASCEYGLKGLLH